VNVEELREIADALVADAEATGVATLLSQLRDALTRQVSEPANADLQTAVASARSALADALRAGATSEFNARWRELVEEMGIDFLLPEEMLTKLDDLFLQNQVTPQVISEAISAMSEEVASTIEHLRNLTTTLELLNLRSSALGPGEFEAAVVIPRREVDNSLGALGREFEDLEQLIRPFVEAADGSPPPVEVRQIASSNFVAVVCMLPGAALLLSKAIDGVLAVYERVLKIRKLRQELTDAGLKADTVDAIETDATEMVDREVPSIVREVVEGAAALPTDDGRRNEIEVAITKSVRGIAKRIDHGYRMTVRAGPAPEPDEVDDEDGEGGDGEGGAAAELAAIRELVIENQKRADYQELAGKPILRELGAGTETDEGVDGP
jgi:hypothetical protein